MWIKSQLPYNQSPVTILWMWKIVGICYACMKWMIYDINILIFPEKYFTLKSKFRLQKSIDAFLPLKYTFDLLFVKK